MPVVNSIARFEPGEPGYGKLTISRFNAMQSLGPDYATCIDLIIVRKNEAHLDNWVSPNQDGFLSIQPKNPRQRAQDFIFEVGPEIVNPMAFDNSGDYILRVRDKNGIILSFNLGMNGTPRADTAYVSNVQAYQQTARYSNMGAHMPPHAGYAGAEQGGAGIAGAAAGVGAQSFAADASAQGFGAQGVGAQGAGVQGFGADASVGGAGAANAFASGDAQAGSMGFNGTGTSNGFKSAQAADTGASSSSGIGSKLAMVGGLVLFLCLVGAGVSYFMGMWGSSSDTVVQEETKADDEKLALTDEEKKQASADKNQADETSSQTASTKSASAASKANAIPNERPVDLSQSSKSKSSGTVFVGGTISAGGAAGGSSSAAKSTAPCTFVGKSGSSQQILSDCLKSSPNTAQLNSFLKEALQGGHCEVAVKLLSSKGRDAGGGNYAYLYAQLSDPNSKLRSNCIPKSSKDAAYWMLHAKSDSSFKEETAKQMSNYFLQ